MGRISFSSWLLITIFFNTKSSFDLKLFICEWLSGPICCGAHNLPTLPPEPPFSRKAELSVSFSKIVSVSMQGDLKTVAFWNRSKFQALNFQLYQIFTDGTVKFLHTPSSSLAIFKIWNLNFSGHPAGQFHSSNSAECGVCLCCCDENNLHALCGAVRGASVAPDRAHSFIDMCPSGG